MQSYFKNMLLTLVVATSINYSFGQVQRVEIIATGLTCSMCSNAINKQLQAIPEVENVETDLNTNTFVVTSKTGSDLSAQVLKERVEKAGFFVGSMVVTIPAEQLSNRFSLLDEVANSATGLIKVQVLNEGFVTTKEFKKVSKKYSSALVASSNAGRLLVKVIE